MNDRNLGLFKLSEYMVRSEPEKVAAIFALIKCVPVRVEVLFSDQSIEYLAIAEPFDEVTMDQLAPRYVLIVETDDEGWPQSVTVRKDI